jgi:hypothetical protein
VTERFRFAVILSLAVWASCSLTWAGLLASERFIGCRTLTTAGSDYGQQRWVWLPPGNRCTWDLTEGRHTEDPPTARLGILALLVAWPASTVFIAKTARRPAE